MSTYLNILTLHFDTFIQKFFCCVNGLQNMKMNYNDNETDIALDNILLDIYDLTNLLVSIKNRDIIF